MTTPYERCSAFSEQKITELREKLYGLTLGDRIVLLCGSFARREASEQSDIDFSIISDHEHSNSNMIDVIRTKINKVVPAGPGGEGAARHVETNRTAGSSVPQSKERRTPLHPRAPQAIREYVRLHASHPAGRYLLTRKSHISSPTHHSASAAIFCGGPRIPRRRHKQTNPRGA